MDILREKDTNLAVNDEILTPALQVRVLEHNMEKEDKELENTWKSCCGLTSDRRMVQHLSQLGVITLIMAFSMMQLIRLDRGDSEPYLGLLTFAFGLVIPTPQSSFLKK